MLSVSSVVKIRSTEHTEFGQFLNNAIFSVISVCSVVKDSGGELEQQVIGDKIKRFLGQQFPATKNVGDQDPLLKNGLIDSLGILEVVTFLEKEFGFTVTDEELLPENFESIRSLSNFAKQKMNGRSAG